MKSNWKTYFLFPNFIVKQKRSLGDKMNDPEFIMLRNRFLLGVLVAIIFIFGLPVIAVVMVFWSSMHKKTKDKEENQKNY